jgi:hypothetical protein
VIERRRVGRVELTGALSTHDLGHVKEITDALASCHVIAFEEVGLADEEARGDRERLYTELLAKEPSVTKIRLAEAAANSSDARTKSSLNLNQPGDAFQVQFLKEFLGSGKRAVVLDITEKTEGFGAERLDAVRAALMDYGGAVATLAPVQEARKASEHAVISLAELYAARDPIIAQQLNELSNVLDRDESDPPQTVGAMVGMMHYRAIMSVGESADPAATQASLHEITKTLTLFEQAIEAYRNNGHVDPPMVNRVLISQYFSASHLTALDGRQANNLAMQLDDDQITRMLDDVDDYVSFPTNDPMSHVQGLKTYLTSVVGLIENQH